MKSICLGFLIMFVCQPTDKPPDAIRGFCTTAQVIKPSRRDTAETLAQVRANNAKIARLCQKVRATAGK